jgi:hypothetical protein
MEKTSTICLILVLFLSALAFISRPNIDSSAQQPTMQQYNTTACQNNTLGPANYLTVTCKNTLIKTNDTITNVDCDTSSGWFILCAWQQQGKQGNVSSPSQISVSSSMDGGQSFNNTIINFSNSTDPARSPEVGLASNFAYLKYEEMQGGNNSEVKLATSSDGGATFDQPINISNSTTNSINSTLIVNPVVGNYLVTWIEQGDDSVVAYCGRC